MRVFLKVVGSIDQMELDDGNNVDKNSGSIPDSKSVVRPFDAEKSKGKRKLYVGSQALGYCRDHMEVRLDYINRVSWVIFFYS